MFLFAQEDDQSDDNETAAQQSTAASEQGPGATATGPMPPIAGLKPVNNADKPLLR